MTGKEKQMAEAKEDRGQRKVKIRKNADGKEGNIGIAYFRTKDQAIKTIKTLNKSKQCVSKQCKINDENGSREQKQDNFKPQKKIRSIDRTAKRKQKA